MPDQFSKGFLTFDLAFDLPTRQRCVSETSGMLGSPSFGSASWRSKKRDLSPGNPRPGQGKLERNVGMLDLSPWFLDLSPWFIPL